MRCLNLSVCAAVLFFLTLHVSVWILFALSSRANADGIHLIMAGGYDTRVVRTRVHDLSSAELVRIACRHKPRL